MNTGKKRILHNVASRKWGTGPDGKGDNMFGMLLMELRDEIRTKKQNQQALQSKPLVNAKHTKYDHQANNSSTKQKPSVLLVGNSHTAGIRPHVLSKNFSTTRQIAYTLDDAFKILDDLKADPNAIVLQLTTNEAKSNRPITDIIKDYNRLVKTAKSKVPKAKVLISEAPNQPNTSRLSVRISAINAALAEEYHASDVTCIPNSQVRYFTNDGIHLTQYGTSQLAMNIKRAVEKCFGIVSNQQYQHNRNFNNHYNSQYRHNYYRY